MLGRESVWAESESKVASVNFISCNLPSPLKLLVPSGECSVVVLMVIFVKI